jgi:diguanylate cyclase (GGDEF)-like protein
MDKQKERSLDCTFFKKKDSQKFYAMGINYDNIVKGFIGIENSQRPFEEVSKFLDITVNIISNLIKKRNMHKFKIKDNLEQHKIKKIDDVKNYNNLPGLYAKFLIADKIKLLEASKGFYELIGMDQIECNSLLFPPVFKEDIRVVGSNIVRAQTGKPVSFEFRFEDTNGMLKYLKVEGKCIGLHRGFPIYGAAFYDITLQKQSELHLINKKANFKFAIDNCDEEWFEYDIVNDIYTGICFLLMEYSSNSVSSISNYLDHLNKTFANPSKDILRWMDLLNGKVVDSFELHHVYHHNNESIHFVASINSKVIYKDFKPVKVIGSLSKINKFSDCCESTIENSLYDSLTQVYKKTYGEQMIKKYLKNSHNEVCVLVIDIDHFKKVNQNYGYMFGNIILNEFASLLNSIKKNKIVYRLIDDCFVVMLEDCTIEQGQLVGSRVCQDIKNIYIGDDETLNLTCSVGVSLINENDFDDALLKAHNAVFQIKKSGEGVCRCYRDDYNNNGLKENVSEINKLINLNSQYSNLYSQKVDDIIYFALEILEKAKNIRYAVNILLSHTGKQFNLNSIVISTLNFVKEKGEIKYWWRADGVYPEAWPTLVESRKALNEMISKYDVSGNLEMTTDEANDFYENNKPFTDQSKILLNFANYELDNYTGSIFFEHKDAHHSWTAQTKSTLQGLAKIIFTNFKRANDEVIIREKLFFLSKMSHEIRTPLNGIAGITKIAKNANGNLVKISDCLEKIDMSSKYLLTLINNMLDISRIESRCMKLCCERFDLNEALDNLECLMRVQAEEKKIRLRFIKRLTETQLVGDVIRLNQVLINIIGNAFKFTPERGYVIVICEEVSKDNDNVMIYFSVKDNGIGIKKENIERIFLPFEQESSRISRDFGGTGLGLTISHSLVKLMGGSLKVRSEEGQGTEFYFTIPLSKSECLNQNEDQSLSKKINYDSSIFFGKRILLAEDNDLNAEIAQTILESVGFIVEVVNDGSQAVNQFNKKEAYYYDLILMDIRMPVMDGLQATQAIRASDKQDCQTIPILAMTANSFAEELQESLSSGMNGYMTKPIDLNLMYKELNKVLSKV